MFEVAHPGWLTDLLAQALSGRAIPSSSLDSLATGFIGCNVVCHLAEFLANLSASSSASLFGDTSHPSFFTLRRGLSRSPEVQPALEELRSPNGVLRGTAALNAGTRHFDPWWQANRWLAIEASLRMWAGEQQPISFLAPAQAALGPVTAQEADAFVAWWQVTSAALVTAWKAHPWHLQEATPPRQIGAVLVRELAPTRPQLIALVHARYDASGAALSNPGETVSLGRLASRLVTALSTSEDVELVPSELALIETCGAGAWVQPGDLIAHSDLLAVVEALQTCWPPSSNGAARHPSTVQRLFGYPISAETNFVAWADVMVNQWGLPGEFRRL